MKAWSRRRVEHRHLLVSFASIASLMLGETAVAGQKTKAKDQEKAGEHAAKPEKSDKSAKPPQPKSFLDLQEHKQVESQGYTEGPGATGSATLTNLNPYVNTWYLLRVRWPESKKEHVFHIENPEPTEQKLLLPSEGEPGLLILSGKERFVCDFWAKGERDAIRKTIILKGAYTPICESRLFVRSKIDGRKTAKEWVVEFMRDNVWGGEELASFVKEKLLKDHFLITADPAESDGGAEGGGEEKKQSKKNRPIPAALDPKFEGQLLNPEEFGLSLKFEADRKMKAGRWYEHQAVPGVYGSAVTPDRLSEEVLGSHKNLVAKLDSIESKALAYLVAFDLDRFDLGFAMGTDHPRIDWSNRALPESVDKRIPGPDGVGGWEPLATTGMVNPINAKRAVAAFTGGFKRDHGAFKWGKLASTNRASHYGFIESGVVFSRLQPNLSTLFVTQDGIVELRTWTDADAKLAKVVRHARQNGVPILDYDPETKKTTPGALVKSWGGGNWSGSEDSKFRTLRAGVCMQYNGDKQYLIYGYFSSVTPSAMTRVFQGYGCRYAMHLDMNALEHTYLAIYPSDGKSTKIEHLITGMKVLDKSFKKRDVPRFIGFPDNRDFFYLTRKPEGSN